jgi:hypothetical protein
MEGDPRRSEDAAGTDAAARCRALEARVAELERQLAEARRGPAASRLEVKAMRLLDHGWARDWALRPSPARRHWMDGLSYSYQCLPMVMANQWGWQVLCPTDVVVRWDGSVYPAGLSIEMDPAYRPAIKSQFGFGIVTFSPPWLFRTSPGWDLYAKGPGNRWKPNCVPLEGVIETWWLNYTFTLNWKLVEPGVVSFARGESLGQLVPVPHGTFQDASAEEVPILHADPAAAEELERWLKERRRRAAEPDTAHRLYRKAEGIEDHLVKLRVPPFLPPGAEDPLAP